MKTALKLSLTITLIALSNLLTLPAAAASNGQSNTAKKPGGPTATLLVDSLAGGSGSTIGPGGALFVTEGPTGSILRVDPDTGETGTLLEVNAGGTFTVIVDGLNQPTSVEFIGNTAYVVTLGGEIWRIDDVSTPPYGASR